MKCNTSIKKYAFGLAFTFGVLLSAPASAVTTFTSCVGTGYDISANVEGATNCTISDITDNDSETNVNATPGFFNITNWILGGKLGDISDPGYEGTGDQVDDDTGQVGGSGGTFDITAVFQSTWENIMFVFKDGSGTTLVGYLLDSGVLEGDWLNPFLSPPFDKEKDTSHISVYYTECPPGRLCGPPVGEVPLPAGILLLISALGGLGFLSRFRSKLA